MEVAQRPGEVALQTVQITKCAWLLVMFCFVEASASGSQCLEQVPAAGNGDNGEAECVTCGGVVGAVQADRHQHPYFARFRGDGWPCGSYGCE